MRFEVLGPLQVRDQDDIVRIPFGLAERLLAVLLSHQGGRVSSAELIDALWPDSSSKAPLKNLQVTVLRLRRALEADERIAEVGGGYRLRLQPGELDSQIFADLVAEAQLARRRGEDTDASDLFAQALALWRGSPYSGLEDCGALASEIHRLSEQRLRALEDHAEASLRLGLHGELVPQLSTLVAEHPNRERAAGLLMLAYYRSNRQAEALELYRRTRANLIEEHGVEPGYELRALHEQILRTDPELDLNHPVTRRTIRPAVPAQLPVGVRCFAGRHSELAQLTALIPEKDTSATVVISALAGTAGVGKTALAIHWAHRMADRFPDGQLYANLRGFDPHGTVADPADVVRDFLDALGIPPDRIPAGLDAQAALYRSQLAGKQVLIVLDNARDTGQVRPLLPGSSSCLTLVTSRNDLTGLVVKEGAWPLKLDVLTEADARQLLERRLGRERVAAEPDAVHDIVAACGGLPLALAIIASRTATDRAISLRTLADDLRSKQPNLDAFAVADDPSADVRTVFSWSYRQLTPEAGRLFRLLGLHPGPDISSAATASLAGLALGPTQSLLAELTHAHLIAQHTPGRYSLHDLLRAYAAELAHSHQPESERDAAGARMLDHYLHTAFAADRLLAPVRNPITLPDLTAGCAVETFAGYEQAMDWFVRERAVLLTVLGYAVTLGLDTHVWQLAWSLDTFLHRRWYKQDRIMAWNEALAGTQRLGDRAVQVQVERLLAHALTEFGRLQEAHAHLQHVLDLDAGIGDPMSQAFTHRALGQVLERLGRHSESLHHRQQALEFFRAADHHPGHAAMLNDIGWTYCLLGDYEQALAHCRQSLALQQELGNRVEEAVTWDSLGYAHHHIGEHQAAFDCYGRALTMYRDLGFLAREADTLTHIGDLHKARNDINAARQSWREALTIFDDLDHPDADPVRARLNGREP